MCVYLLIRVFDLVSRPSFLVLTGPPSSRQSLVNFAKLVSRGKSLFVCGNIVIGERDSASIRLLDEEKQRGAQYLKKRKVRYRAMIIHTRDCDV